MEKFRGRVEAKFGQTSIKLYLNCLKNLGKPLKFLGKL